MSYTSSIEYYSTCPSCGGAGQGQAVCMYCGTSLVKKKMAETVGSEYVSPEAQYAMEDAGLPQIQGTFAGPNMFLLLFCLAFGGGFLLIPGGIFAGFVATGMFEWYLLAFFSIFWMIGIAAFCVLFTYLGKRNKIKNGKVITAVVHGYGRGNMYINDMPVLTVKLLIDEFSDPKLLTLNTGSTERKYALGQTIKLRNYQDLYEII